MRIQPVAGPNQVNPPVNTVATQSQLQARERAIQRLSSQQAAPAQAQATPVANPNQISPEEMGAISHSEGQENINEAPENQAEDTPPVTAPPEPKPEDPALSRQFAALARQEKQMRLRAQKQEASFKAREEALKAKEAELASKQFDPDAYISKDRFQKDPLGVMAETGLAWEQVAEQIATQQAIPPQLQAHINRIEAELKQLKTANEDSKKSVNEAQQQQYQAAVKQIRMDAQHLVNSDPAYESIKATNSVKDVVELITKTFEDDGRLMTVEEACEEVENHLTEEIERLMKLEKIQKRQRPTTSASQATGAPTQTPVKQDPPKQQPMKTLTNATGSTRPLSARERAVLAFNGKLK